MKLRLGELFAGYGGLGMGVESALHGLGHEVERVFVSDIEPGPCAILAHHWPDVPNLGDITQVDWMQVPRVDVLTGGFPCQDVSTAGKQAGLAPGTRSGLWGEFARAIAVLRPSLVVIENVRGLLSAPASRGDKTDDGVERCPICMDDGSGGDLRALGAVLGDLADLGLDAEWGMLAAADVGAAHRRDRVFIVAWPADADRNLLRKHCRESSAQEAWPHEGHRSANPGGGSRADRLMPTPEAKLAQSGPDYARASRAASGGHDLATAAALLPTPTVSDSTSSGGSVAANVTLTDAATGRRGYVHEAAPAMHGGRFGVYEDAVARWACVVGRSAPDATDPGDRGGVRLSPGFVEWLMGLPEGHVTGVGLTRAQELRALGNGVVPLQAEAAVQALLVRAFSEEVAA